MPDLTIQVQEIKGFTGTALVILNGSIDAKTVITFQTHLNSVKERGIAKFVIDMENVKYVNSTGLGYLINLSDSVGAERSGISLVRVQPKVKVVFDMLGLNAFFKIYATREDAYKHLAPEGAAKAPEPPAPPLKASPPPAPQPAPPPAPVRRMDAPAPAPARPPSTYMQPVRPAETHAAAPAHAPAHAPAPAEQVHIECQSCRALMSVREVGTYKCPRCHTLFNYVGDGKVSFLPRQKTMPLQLSLNFTSECTEGLLDFVRRLAAKSGFSAGGISEVQSAVRDTVDTIRKHAYGGNDGNIYHVLLLSVDSELELRFADYGTSLNSDKGDLFSGVRRAMDRFEHKTHPRGGNVLVLSKKAK